jgi:capsular polysaccharide biosynthesis protein
MDSITTMPKFFRDSIYSENLIQIIKELNKDGIEVPVNILNWLDKIFKEKWISTEHSIYFRSKYRNFFKENTYDKLNMFRFKLIDSNTISNYTYLLKPTIKNLNKISISKNYDIEQTTHFAHINGVNLLTLAKAVVIGGSSLILLPNKRFYCEHFEGSRANNVKFNHDPYLISFQNPIAEIGKIKISRNIPTAINLVGTAHSHFAHFILNGVIKLLISNKFGVDKRTPILVDDDVSDHLVQLIEKIGFAHIIKLKFGECIGVDRLLQATNYNLFPDYKQSAQLDPSINALDSRLFNYFDEINVRESVSSPKKVYIPRLNSDWGRIENEQILMDKFSEIGFKIIYPERMSIDEQIEIFYQVECIVTAPSSSLINLLYAKSKPTVHVLASKYLFNNVAWFGPLEDLGAKIKWHPILIPTSLSKHSNFEFELDKIAPLLQHLSNSKIN